MNDNSGADISRRRGISEYFNLVRGYFRNFVKNQGYLRNYPYKLSQKDFSPGEPIFFQNFQQFEPSSRHAPWYLLSKSSRSSRPSPMAMPLNSSNISPTTFLGQ